MNTPDSGIPYDSNRWETALSSERLASTGLKSEAVDKRSRDIAIGCIFAGEHVIGLSPRAHQARARLVGKPASLVCLEETKRRSDCGGRLRNWWTGLRDRSRLMTDYWSVFIYSIDGVTETSEIMDSFAATLAAVKAFKQGNTEEILNVLVPVMATEQERNELRANGAILCI
jgi:hypothetical protein